MDLANFIYWMLVSMGACFLVAAVFAIRHISIYFRSFRIYPEMPDKEESVLSRYPERASNVSLEDSSTERRTIHFKKESISSGEKYIFEETL